MPRLVLFNDLHFSHHPPECRADSYSYEILDKLHEVARIALKLKVSVIGCSGDWFHRKGRVSFREANDLLTVLRGWRDKGFDVVGILGNHDIAGHSLDSLDNRAVGSLVHSRTLHLLDHEPYSVGGVHVTGTSYFHGCDSDDESRLRMYGAVRPGELAEGICHVHVAHGTLLQRGEFFEDYTTAPELIELLHEHDRLPDVIVCGHLHFPEGVRLYDHPGKPGRNRVAVCRVGSLARVASDDFDRRPKVLLIAVERNKFLCREIPVGGEVKRGGDPGDHRDPCEQEERIQEFVRVLREEADSFALADHGSLLREIASRMGHDDEVLGVAMDAVERRQ